jgi:thymidylate kinase
MFDSFLKYQSLVALKFKELQATYDFTIVDGRRSPDEINIELRKRIESVLAGK